VVALLVAAVALPIALARSDRVINLTIENKQFHPAVVNAHDGDVLHICQKDPFGDKLFSFSQYNRFGGGSHPGGINLHQGACSDVTLHDPTSGPVSVKIFSENHSQEKLRIAVYPKGSPFTGPPGVVPAPARPTNAFTLVPSLTQVENNVGAPELTITDTASGMGALDHTGQYGGAGKGGEWKVAYHWAVPSTLTPGKTAAIYVQIVVTAVNPEQPISFQMNAIAPNFAQALQCHYPSQPCSMTFPYEFAEDEVGAADVSIDIGFEDSHVIFHYRESK